jgi:plastocyanin
MRLNFRIGAFFLISLLLFKPSHPLFAYEEVDVAHGGTLRGTVRWKEAVMPQRAVHQVVKNTDFCGKTFEDDALMIHPENRGMQNVAVFLENIEKGRAPQGRYVNIVEKCRFKPRVMPVVKGTLLGFRHNDFILHNLHAFLMENNATLFNIGLPIHRWQQVVGQTIRRTGLFKLQCDIHAHMNGLILSLEHDYFAVTDSEGRFEIEEIPPGKYRLAALQAGYRIQAWQAAEEGGRRPIYEAPHRITREVEVTADGEIHVNFEFDTEN